MADSTGRNLLKYGCLGCAGLVIVALVLTGIVLGVARMQVAGEEVERRTVEAPIPEPVDRGPLDGTAGAAGRVVLDLGGGGFHIEPAAPGGGLAVDASYDSKFYALEESLESGDDGRWTYRVRFSRQGSGWVAALRQLMGGQQPIVRVTLPRDVELDLEVSMNEGGLESELGGLWLGDVALSLSRGAISVGFDEPTREPLRSLVFDGRMGGFDMQDVGNASPARLDVSCRMGGLQLDLAGPWRNDAEISIVSRMSGGAVVLPKRARFEGIDRPGMAVTQDDEIRPPLLRFRVEVTQGDVQFID